MEVIAAEFARMAGVTDMAISKKISNGKLIRNSGGKLDTDNILNRAYLDKKQKEAREKLEKKQRAAQANLAGEIPAQNSAPQARPGEALADKTLVISGAAGQAMNMTLRELIVRHGNLDNVEKYTKILRDLTTADDREQKIQERRLLQIPKDFVIGRIFGFLEELTNKLLDVPESISDQVLAVALADDGSSRQQVADIISAALTRCIAGSKEKILSELETLKSKYEKRTAQEEMLNEIAQKMEVEA